MSSITTEKYDPVKLERLKYFLEASAERGKPKYFEIFVDNLKAVDKNNDPACFDDYTMYLNADSKMVKVLIYTTTESSPRNDKFIYNIVNEIEEKQKNQKQNQELNGIELQTRIDSAITTERERNQNEQLKKELETVKAELVQAEEYIESLEEDLTTERTKKHSWKELNLGNVASIAIEEVVKRNPGWMKKVPLLGALSGLADSESTSMDKTGATENGNASFKKKAAEQPSGETNEAQVEFFRQMEETFSEEQLQKVMEINTAMLQHDSLVDTIHELVYENPENK